MMLTSSLNLFCVLLWIEDSTEHCFSVWLPDLEVGTRLLAVTQSHSISATTTSQPAFTVAEVAADWGLPV